MKALILPANTFDTSIPFETVALELDTLPVGITHDYDATDADSLTLSSSRVTQWRDQRNEVALNATGDDRPLYVANHVGYPAVKFEATPALNYIGAPSLTHDLRTGYTVAMVFSTPTTANAALWTADPTNNRPAIYVNTNTIRARHTTDTVLPTTFPVNAPVVVLMSYDSTAGKVDLYINGALIAGSPATINAPGDYRGIYFGRLGTIGSSVLHMHKFLMRDRKSTAGEAAKINRILRNQFPVVA